MIDPADSDDQEVHTEQRRQSTRMETLLPVQFTVIDGTGEPLARGNGFISSLSQEGLALSGIRLTRGAYPLSPHELIISPLRQDLSTLWVKVKPIHIQFLEGGAQIGASILKTSTGFERLFDAEPEGR